MQPHIAPAVVSKLYDDYTDLITTLFSGTISMTLSDLIHLTFKEHAKMQLSKASLLRLNSKYQYNKLLGRNAFTALTLLVGRQDEHRACKN